MSHMPARNAPEKSGGTLWTIMVSATQCPSRKACPRGQSDIGLWVPSILVSRRCLAKWERLETCFRTSVKYRKKFRNPVESSKWRKGGRRSTIHWVSSLAAHRSLVILSQTHISLQHGRRLMEVQAHTLASEI